MKTILTCTLFAMCFNAFAQQQTAKVNESLLLDFYQIQHFKEAADYLKSVYPEPIKDIKALSRLAYTTQMAGQLPDAESYYQCIFAADSSNQAALYSLASINYKRGNLLKAEAYYQKVLQRDSLNFSVYKQLATISYNRGDVSRQITYLQKANKLNPSDADVASELSDMLVALKVLGPAEKALNGAIIADPENVVLLESLVKLSYAQHKWPETIATGEQLIGLGSNALSVLSKLGQAYYVTKNYQCGVDVLKSINEGEQNETTYYFTALCYKALNDQKNAIDYFTKAITAGISPNTGSYYNEMADGYRTLRQHKKAVYAYQKSLQFEEKPMTYYALATVYDADLKDKQNALKYYKKYLATKPEKDQQTYIAYSQARVAELKN